MEVCSWSIIDPYIHHKCVPPTYNVVESERVCASDLLAEVIELHSPARTNGTHLLSPGAARTVNHGRATSQTILRCFSFITDRLSWCWGSRLHYWDRADLCRSLGWMQACVIFGYD